MGVFESGGAQALEGYEVPLLSWDDYQAIRAGEAPAALEAGEAGAAARGRLLEGGKPGAGAGGQEGACAAALEHSGSAGGAGGPGGDGDDGGSEAGSVDVEELCELD